MPKYKSGLFKVTDPNGNVISTRMLIQTKKVRDQLEKEGYVFEEVQ
ncbi:MAG: hypothetical protein ACTSPI_13575 [Candidatus Heimdallarchaeaceae archaeon]